MTNEKEIINFIYQEIFKEEHNKYFFSAVHQLREKFSYKMVMDFYENQIGSVTDEMITKALKNEDRESLEEYLDYIADHLE